MPKSKAKAKKAVCCPLCGNSEQEALVMVYFPNATLIFCDSCGEIVLVQKVTKLISKSDFVN
jgi:transcription elongation factor Elf1